MGGTKQICRDAVFTTGTSSGHPHPRVVGGLRQSGGPDHSAAVVFRPHATAAGELRRGKAARARAAAVTRLRLAQPVPPTRRATAFRRGGLAGPSAWDKSLGHARENRSVAGV